MLCQRFTHVYDMLHQSLAPSLMFVCSGCICTEMGGKSPKLVVLSIGLGCLSLLLSGKQGKSKVGKSFKCELFCRSNDGGEDLVCQYLIIGVTKRLIIEMLCILKLTIIFSSISPKSLSSIEGIKRIIYNFQSKFKKCVSSLQVYALPSYSHETANGR